MFQYQTSYDWFRNPLRNLQFWVTRSDPWNFWTQRAPQLFNFTSFYPLIFHSCGFTKSRHLRRWLCTACKSQDSNFQTFENFVSKLVPYKIMAFIRTPNQCFTPTLLLEKGKYKTELWSGKRAFRNSFNRRNNQNFKARNSLL